MPQPKTQNSQSSEMTGTSNSSKNSGMMENSIFPDTLSMTEQGAPAQSKSSRPTAKQRKSDLDEYLNVFFAPIKLGKGNKHQVAISNDTFDRVERIARFFGGSGYSVGSFIEHIINEHLDANSANYESWFTVIGKSF